VNKIQTGISGIDKMLYGGIPETSQILISGGPGAGKTLMSFEYLYRNAKMGNTSVLFAFEEEPARILENVKSAFSELTDIDDLVRDGKLIIDGKTPSDSILGASDDGHSAYEFGKVLADMESLIMSTKANRVVVDSLSVFNMLIRDDALYRKYMLALILSMRRLGVTSIMTTEMESPERHKLVFKPEYFIFDGIIALYQTGEESKRMLATEILKIRGSKHSFVTTPYEITPAGFRIFAAEDIAPY
jgi:KaiC/GvpD/RAD55 family RecA-like ATPase